MTQKEMEQRLTALEEEAKKNMNLINNAANVLRMELNVLGERMNKLEEAVANASKIVHVNL